MWKTRRNYRTRSGYTQSLSWDLEASRRRIDYPPSRLGMQFKSPLLEEVLEVPLEVFGISNLYLRVQVSISDAL